MKKLRKTYSLPFPLVPPKTIWKIQFIEGRRMKERVRTVANDDGRKIDGRIYHYNHTKGWKSARATA